VITPIIAMISEIVTG
jgi:hypothetical protein